LVSFFVSNKYIQAYKIVALFLLI